MPHSSTRSRQKVCDACAKAKRRCVPIPLPAGTGVCTRCESKALPCIYKPTPFSARAAPTLSNSDDLSSEHESQPHNPSVSHIGHMTGLDIALPPLPGEEVAQNPISFDPGNFDFLDQTSLVDPFPDIGTMDRDRIRYCAKQLRSYPEMLFKTGRTPYIHPHTYKHQMPNALQDAFSVAALYLGKNDENEDMIWTVISSKAHQLIQPHISWSMSDHLTSLQALIIFQIIRLFDGDIRQRAEAEVYEESLMQWTESLAKRADFSDMLVLNNWDSWVFEESIRRTIIVSFMVRAMYSIQKQGFCTLVTSVDKLSFTGNNKLWNARSAEHWQQASQKHNSFDILRMNFDEILSCASVEDIDDLAILMMVTYKGVEGVNEWIGKNVSASLIG